MRPARTLPIVAVLLSACGPSQQDYEKVRDRASELEAQVKTLRAELEDVKFGATRLLAQARTAYDAGRDAESKKLLTELLRRHPSSPESNQAAALLVEVDQRLAAVQLQRERDAAAKAQEDRLALERAVGNMKKQTDEIKGITWFSHRDSPILGKLVSAYFGSSKGSAERYPLRLKFQYYGDDWLFVRSITVKADDKVYELGPLDVERDNSSGSIWEWVDFPVSDHEMLKHWFAAKRVVVRFEGDQYYDDFVLPQAQQAQLREVYRAWETMGGKP